MPNTDFLGTQPEFPRLHVTIVANDDVKQDHAGLFTFDPIGRIDEWRAAMLADPSHTRQFSKDDAIAICRTVPFRKGKYWMSDTMVSRLANRTPKKFFTVEET